MCTPHRLCLALILCLLPFVCARTAHTQTGVAADPGNKIPVNTTALNEITYGDYHMFRGESRMMPGFSPAAEDGLPDPGSAHPPAAAPPPPQ